MRLIVAWGAALLLVGCGGDGSEGPGADAPDATADATALDAAAIQPDVEAFLRDYMDAIGARDAARIRTALGSDDRFVWIEDGEVRYRSADELLEGLEQLLPGAAIRTELTDLTVVPLGPGMAHAWGTHQTTFGEGADAFSFGGAISFVLERRGSSWVVVGGHTSSPRPGGG